MSDSAHQILSELYGRHGRAGVKLAYLMTGDPVEAEDIVHDAFVRLFARLRNRGSPEAVDRYLRRTIVNLSHDRHRRLRTARGWLARQSASTLAESPPDIETRASLHAVLQSLPHRQRAALILRYYEDLSEEQAAEILKCSVGALKQLVQRGLRALRERGVDGDE